jgi:hypothetical protein
MGLGVCLCVIRYDRIGKHGPQRTRFSFKPNISFPPVWDNILFTGIFVGTDLLRKSSTLAGLVANLARGSIARICRMTLRYPLISNIQMILRIFGSFDSNFINIKILTNRYSLRMSVNRENERIVTALRDNTFRTRSFIPDSKSSWSFTYIIHNSYLTIPALTIPHLPQPFMHFHHGSSICISIFPPTQRDAIFKQSKKYPEVPRCVQFKSIASLCHLAIARFVSWRVNCMPSCLNV